MATIMNYIQITANNFKEIYAPTCYSYSLHLLFIIIFVFSFSCFVFAV